METLPNNDIIVATEILIKTAGIPDDTVAKLRNMTLKKCMKHLSEKE